MTCGSETIIRLVSRSHPSPPGEISSTKMIHLKLRYLQGTKLFAGFSMGRDPCSIANIWLPALIRHVITIAVRQRVVVVSMDPLKDTVPTRLLGPS